MHLPAVDVDVKAFLVTGRLGPLSLGESRERSVAELGPPDDVSVSRSAPEILRFGMIQIMFLEKRAVFLSVAFDRPPLVQFPNIRFIGWTPVPGMSLDAFRRSMQEFGIEVAVDDRVVLEFQTTLRVIASGVRVAFIDQALDKIYIAEKNPKSGG